MLYTALYMSNAIRTQIYLTNSQREQLDALSKRENKSLAQLIREAVDAYLPSHGADMDELLDRTFGTIPDLQVPPRSEWDRV